MLQFRVRAIHQKLFRSLCLFISAVGLWSAGLGAAHALNAPVCLSAFKSPLSIPITGQLTEVIIDGQCTHAYVTNATNSTVEVISLLTGRLQTPIQVGSAPTGLDISPDGKTLYVANSGGNILAIVDLRAGVETAKVPVAPNPFINDTPFSLAVANSGLVLFSTTFAGSGFGGRMMQFDPVTKTVSKRSDFFFGGDTTEVTYLKASGDRSVVGAVAGDISSGPVFRFSSSANSFGPEKDLNGFVSFIGLDQTGATILVNPGTDVLTSSLALSGTIGGDGQYGIAVDPGGAIGYRVGPTSIEILNLRTFTQAGSLPIGDTLASGNTFRHGVGEVAISRDGTVLAVITDHGLSLVQSKVVQFVNFASMSAHARLQLRPGSGLDSFEVEGSFDLGRGAKVIDPRTQNATLEVGSVSAHIPPGAFKQSDDDFQFEGKIDNVNFKMSLSKESAGHYRYRVHAQGANLDGSTLPLAVAWEIGENRGSVALESGEVELGTSRERE